MVASNLIDSTKSNCLSDAYFLDKLIRLYLANECLWNPKSPGYRNSALNTKAWHRISHLLNNEFNIDELKSIIISLRQFYETKRLMETRGTRTQHNPQEAYYKKLQFLKNTEMENFNAKDIEDHPNHCNSQINCIVEDTFLLSNSQNSIHSEQSDLGLHYSLVDDYSRIESLEISNKNNRFQLPYPPIEFRGKNLEIRAVSGNDGSHDRDAEEHDDYGRKHNTTFKIRPCSNSSIASQSDGHEISRRKLLTKKYARPNSRQKLVEYVYATKLNDTRQTSHNYTSNPIFIYRTKSGNDDVGGEQLNQQSQDNCICCPNYTKLNGKAASKEECLEDDKNDQMTYHQRNNDGKNQNQLPPESEYMDAYPNYDTFQSPESTSEDRLAKCCRPHNCPVLTSKSNQGRSQRKERYRDYDEAIVDEQPTSSRQRDQRNVTETCQKECIERQQQKESVRRKYQQTTRPGSTNSNGSGYASKPGQRASQGSKEKQYYCTLNKKPPQQDGKVYIDCPNQFEVCGQSIPLREMKDGPQNDYEETMCGSRSNRRQQIVQNDARYSRENSRRNNDPQPGRTQIRSSQDSQRSSARQYTARTSTRSNQRKYLSETMDMDYYEDQNTDRPSSSNQRNYNPMQTTYDKMDRYQEDDDCCVCTSDEEYSRTYIDDKRNVARTGEKYSQQNDNQERDYWRRDGRYENEQETRDYYRRDYDENNGFVAESPKRRSIESHQVRNNTLDNCVTDCPQDCNELLQDYEAKQSKGQMISVSKNSVKDAYDRQPNEEYASPARKDYPRQSSENNQRRPLDQNQRRSKENGSIPSDGARERHSADDAPRRLSRSYRDVSIETDIDMKFNNRGSTVDASAASQEQKQSTASESTTENENEIDPTSEKPNEDQSKQQTIRKPKWSSKPAQAQVIDKQAKPKAAKQRSTSPTPAKCNCCVRRNPKSDTEDELQNDDDSKCKKYLQTTETPGPYEMEVDRQPSGSDPRRTHARNKLRGMSVLGTFQVPAVLAEKTINIVKKHINNMKPKLIDQAPNKLIASKSYDDGNRVARSKKTDCGLCHQMKSSSNPFRSINYDASKKHVIILHPPTKGFRPSKHSFELNENPVKKRTGERQEHDVTQTADA